MRRSLFVTLFAAAAALPLAVAAPAAALQTGVIDEAADALAGDPVYVDPDAERAISEGAAEDLRDRIRESASPVFLAVLPAAAADEVGGVDQVPTELAERIGLAGTVAVVVGDSFRAGGTGLAEGAAASIATQVFQQHSAEGTEAVLGAFVDEVAEVAGPGAGSGSGGAIVPGPGPDAVPGTAPAADDAGADSDGGGGISTLGLLALVGAGGAGLLLWSRSRRRREAGERAALEREVDADRQLLQAELSVLGDDVMALEHQVTIHPEAREDYDAAVSRFRAAHAAMDYARDDIDLVRVRRVIDEGRYAMARARAKVEGREPPPPPPELTQRGRHDEPALDLDDDGAPVYVGYGAPFYGGGWFGGGGGMLTGLLLGQALSPWGWGGMWGGGTDVYVDGGGGGYGDGGGDGGGWGGGGDWGGGMGGGDWGGGDIGGGDWG